MRVHMLCFIMRFLVLLALIKKNLIKYDKTLIELMKIISFSDPPHILQLNITPQRD